MTAACVLIAAPTRAAEWTSLRTEHFLLLGDAPAREIREVALRFEQYRAAVTSLSRRSQTTARDLLSWSSSFATNVPTSPTSPGSTGRQSRSADTSSALET